MTRKGMINAVVALALGMPPAAYAQEAAQIACAGEHEHELSAVYETQLGALDLADAALFERAQQALADYREATCEPLESMARERAAELRLIGRTRSGP